MRPVARLAVITCLLASAASAQGRPPVDLEPVFAAIAPSGPGCVAGVRIPGAPDQILARGQADLEHADPLTAGAILESGSLAKQFTAAAVMLLAQDGRVGLEDDIRLYLPEMPDYGVPITLRHLLTHTSGLREQWSLMALTGNGPGMQAHTLAMILDLASRQQGLNFKPGAEFLYTNTNYALTAMIVERVSGQSLQRFTDQRLFQPLGMGHTRWREDFHTVVPGRASAYAPADGGFVGGMPFTSVYGNGGLLTTVGDLLRWNAFLDKPSDLPGGATLAAALQTPGRLNDDSVLEYGLGLEISLDHGRRLVSHSGSTGGYKAWLGRYPDQGVSIAVLCNNGGVDPVAMGEQVAERALAAAGHPRAAVSAPKAVAAAQTPRDLAPYSGLFRNPVTGELARVEAVGGQLSLRQGGVQALTARGRDRFRLPNGDIVGFKRQDAVASELTLTRGAVSQRFVAMAPPSQDPRALAAYVGTYSSAELDTRVTVVQQGDGLVMRQAFAVAWPLSPSFADGFTTRLRGSTTFVFERGADGQVTGVRAWANGVRNLLFARQ